MIFNKWLRFGMSASLALLGVAMTMDWSSVVSASTAGKIIGVLGMAKMVMDALAPAVGSYPNPVTGAASAIVSHN